MEVEKFKSVRETYDRIAVEYAAHLSGELVHKPFDRGLLNRFVSKVVPPDGTVCDLGCGPGPVTRYLRDAGANVFGLDLSPGMASQARTLNPEINFVEGDITALDMESEYLAGVAFYSIVNLPRDTLLLAFREMLRVLCHAGLLLLAFHVGDETLRPGDLWGNSISMEFHLFPLKDVKGQLQTAGFTEIEVFEREPYRPDVEYQSHRAYLFARRP